MVARVDFYDEDFKKLIEDKGLKSYWERAIVCNCLTNDTKQPNFNCKLCGGTGFRYLPPKEIRLLATSITGRKLEEELGLRTPGTAYITPPNNIIMGYADRITFYELNCINSEVLLLNSDGSYSSASRIIKKVIHIIDADNEYEEDIDFKIDTDAQHITWLNTSIKPTALSVLYYTSPRYLVTDLLHELRATYSKRKEVSETLKELPKQYLITRENFIYNIGKPIQPTNGKSVLVGDDII